MNIKKAVYNLVVGRGTPITVTEIYKTIDASPNAVYGACKTLFPYIKPVKGKEKRYICGEKSDFVWRIQSLVSKKPMTVSELAEVIGVTKPAIVWHIKKMVQMDLIGHTRFNLRDYYFIEASALNSLKRYCNNCDCVVEWSARGKRWSCLNCGKFHRG